MSFSSPREALDLGIATVFQDLAMIPLLSITRNFFMGREPVKNRLGPFSFMDMALADRIVHEDMRRIGIDVRDPQQPVGTLSGGERQCVAIARAVHFGAKVLILDEPTSALGVAQTSMVLKFVRQVRGKGLGLIFITHNVRHAYAVGDRFTVLNRGKTLGTFAKSEIGARPAPDDDGRRQGVAGIVCGTRRDGVTRSHAKMVELSGQVRESGLEGVPHDVEVRNSHGRCGSACLSCCAKG